MKRLFWHWAISSIALVLVAAALKPHIEVHGWWNVVWIAPLLGLVNAAVGFVAGLIKIVAFPVNALSLGCFGFVVSFLLYSLGLNFLMNKGSGPLAFAMSVDGLGWAMALAVLMALVSTVLNMIIPSKARQR